MYTINPLKEDEMESLSDKLVKISQALLAWLIFVILSPFLLIIFGFLFIWKYGVLWVIVKIFKRKFIKSFDDCESFYAVDRFWESSRSSLGLIVELEGTINVDVFRDDFRKNLLDYPNDSQQSQDEESLTNPFSKLTQIPSTFCGYYFWQKANYFLIHEHIRQINQPTDELGLKKAVGTLMTLPFPNRRPLWEILVYSNYLGTTTVGRGTTCGSALFIRIHRSVTDSQGLMNIFRHMLLSESERGNFLQQVKSVQISTAAEVQKKKESEATVGETENGQYHFLYHMILEKFTNLVYLPLRSFQFARIMVKTPEGIVPCDEVSTHGSSSPVDSAYAGWSTLSEILIWKTCATQTPKLSRSAVELTLFLEGLTSRGRRHKCLNIPEEKGVPTQGKCQTSVLIPLKNVPQSDSEMLTNDKRLSCVKCACIASTAIQAGNKQTFLKSIHDQVENPRANHAQIVKIYMQMLSLLPRHVLRYLLMSFRWGAGFITYEQFQMEIPRGQADDQRVFGQYIVSQVVPLMGLQWTHTAASAASLKWQDRPNVVMSVIANASILGVQGTPQEHLDRIVRGLPEELERLADDEEHGFVSIPIS